MPVSLTFSTNWWLPLGKQLSTPCQALLPREAAWSNAFYIHYKALSPLILSISQERKLWLSKHLLAKSPLSSIGTQVCLHREGIRGPDWCLQPQNTSSRVGLTKLVVQEVSLEEGLPLDLQFRGLGPGSYPAVPTVPRGTAPKGMEFALTSPWGQRRRRRPGAWKASSSPSPPKCSRSSGFIPA